MSKSKKEKPKNQTELMRELIRRNAKRETIVERLVENFGDEENGKDEKWAQSRLKTYERAYGEMGEDDPKL